MNIHIIFSAKHSENKSILQHQQKTSTTTTKATALSHSFIYRLEYAFM